jgi:hypothetical protein
MPLYTFAASADGLAKRIASLLGVDPEDVSVTFEGEEVFVQTPSGATLSAGQQDALGKLWGKDTVTVR